jgi:hypothetical protein
MVGETRRAKRYQFDALAEVEHSAVVRMARVKDLSIHGCYLAMPVPFSKGASVRIKIRTDVEIFLADATVVHSTHDLGMGVTFHAVSPPFLLVLQHWLSEAQQEITQDKLVDSNVGHGDKGLAMEKRKPYTAPRVVQYLPDEIPKLIAEGESFGICPRRQDHLF